MCLFEKQTKTNTKYVAYSPKLGLPTLMYIIPISFIEVLFSWKALEIKNQDALVIIYLTSDKKTIL